MAILTSLIMLGIVAIAFIKVGGADAASNATSQVKEVFKKDKPAGATKVKDRTPEDA